MEIAQGGDGFCARPEHEVICVAQNDLGTLFGEGIWKQAFDGTLSADGHENGRFEGAVARGDAGVAGLAFGGKEVLF
jgi:hypothetical protein